jgi:hypothetical protein
MGNSKKATSAKQWKGKRQTSAGPLDLPSGNTALVMPLDPTAFLSADLLPNPLMAIVRKAINTQKGLPPKAMKQIADDPEMLTSALEMFDRVLVRVVVEPEIQMPPPCAVIIGEGMEAKVCGEYANTDVHKDPTKSGQHAYREDERDEEVLYADQVDMADKMFIFQWCLGGTRDLEKFRREQGATVGSLSVGEDVEVSA